MYLLYLDDSGSVANVNEKYFVLGGVCVPENSTRWLSYELEKLAQEINPENPRDVEFHASEIFGGRGKIWEQFNRQQRIEIIRRVLLVLENAYSSIVTFACAVHKESFPNTDPVMTAFEDLSSRFNLYLRNVTSEYSHKGLIVLDKSSYETSLQNLSFQFKEQGDQWGSFQKSIIEVPLFVNSRASRVIQLADHIAYAVFRRYNAEDLTYFNCIEGRFDQREGKMHGLAHKQTYKYSCTCPACISRR
ncbi:MAG: DUF3800 domain-containing protein [Anaerolineales bacterium]|nr:DUF3800 domain-containing protein [Anaerolineales bacterium]